jgi:hypothetical protein
MSILITDSFGVQTTKPIDDRITAADITARDAIVAGRRFQGLQCYVVSDTKTYVLKTGITNGDWAELGSAGTPSNIISDTFNGTGSQTIFTLTSDPGSITNTHIFVDGVYQAKATYSISTTTLTFTEAPPTGTGNIQVNYGTALSAGVPSDGSVTDVKISTGAITSSKFAVGALNGGSATTSISSDLTLTATSDRVQMIESTVANTNVILPDATTTQEGGAVFFIKNTGLIALYIRDAGGNLIAHIDKRQCAAFYLTDNTTANGVWAVGNESYGSTAMTEFFNSAYTAISTADNTGAVAEMCQLNDTQFIIIWNEVTTLFVKSVVMNIVNNVITFGAIVTVDSAATNRALSITKLTTTTALACYAATGTQVLMGRVLTISGSTISVGAQTSTAITIEVAGKMTAVSQSATQVLIVFRQGTFNSNAAFLTISGGIISAVSGVTTISGASFSTSATVVQLSLTSYVSVFNRSSVLRAIPFTVSGTTITLGTEAIISSIGQCNSLRCAALSSTKFIAVATNATGSTGIFAIASSNGSTITSSGDGLIDTITGVVSSFANVAVLKSDKVFIPFRNNGTNALGYLLANVSGNSLVNIYFNVSLTASPTATPASASTLGISRSKVIMTNPVSGTLDAMLFEPVDV